MVIIMIIDNILKHMALTQIYKMGAIIITAFFFDVLLLQWPLGKEYCFRNLDNHSNDSQSMYIHYIVLLYSSVLIKIL